MGKPMYLRLSDDIYRAIDKYKMEFEAPIDYARRAVIEKLERDKKAAREELKSGEE